MEFLAISLSDNDIFVVFGDDLVDAFTLAKEAVFAYDLFFEVRALFQIRLLAAENISVFILE